VRTHRVVLVDPVTNHDSRFEEAVELLAVQELVAHRVVEALDERVLLRATTLDERGLDAALCQPLAEAASDALAAVVGAQQLGMPMPLEQPGELLDDLAGADRASDAAAERDTRLLVDHIQDAQRAAVGGARAHEVV